MNNRHKKSLYINIVLLFVMLACFLASTKAQYNYIQNPSFEQYDTCPNWIGQIKYTYFWSNLIDHSGGSVDFMHNCANPNPYVGVPDNEGFQAPLSGLGYARLSLFGFSTSNPNSVQTEYMNGKLSKKLIANKQYCVKVHLSLCDYSYCIIDGFGMYFDNGVYSAINSGQVTPQIENPDYNYLSDSVGWIEITGKFTANGTEEYINLGNFKRLQTHYLPTPNDPGNGYYLAAYYIDDVSVIESDLPAFAGNDTALQAIGDSLFLGRPPEIGLECTWYNWAGDSIGSGAGIWVKPTHTQPYIVEQNLCGNITRDTVYVSMGTSLEPSAMLQGLKVFPNPSTDNIRLFVNQKEGFMIEIKDIQGKIIERTYHQALTGELVLATKLTAGIYFIQLTNSSTHEQNTQKVIIY